MSEPQDPTGGWAKATEATAKTVGKAIDVARDLGGFIAGPAREVVGMVHDHLKVTRFERQLRLAERVHALMQLKGLPSPTRQLPLTFGLPLITNASIEEDVRRRGATVAVLEPRDRRLRHGRRIGSRLVPLQPAHGRPDAGVLRGYRPMPHWCLDVCRVR